MSAKTRLGEGGYGVRRYLSFAGKTPSAPPEPVAPAFRAPLLLNSNDSSTISFWKGTNT